MLAADTDFEIAARGAALLHRPVDQQTYAFLIEYSEGVSLEDFLVFVVARELRVIVAREAHRGLREIVGAEAEELGFARDLIGEQRGARDLDHSADQVVMFAHAGLGENFVSD